MRSRSREVFLLASSSAVYRRLPSSAPPHRIPQNLCNFQFMFAWGHLVALLMCLPMCVFLFRVGISYSLRIGRMTSVECMSGRHRSSNGGDEGSSFWLVRKRGRSGGDPRKHSGRQACRIWRTGRRTIREEGITPISHAFLAGSVGGSSLTTTHKINIEVGSAWTSFPPILLYPIV